MSWFYSKDVKEAVRQTREEERAKAHEDRLRLQSQMTAIAEKKIDALIRQKDDEKAAAVHDKENQIRSLQYSLDEKSEIFKRFRRDLENMEILATEMSSLGMAIENITGGLTGKFHGFKTRISIINHSVEKKERKYKALMEK